MGDLRVEVDHKLIRVPDNPGRGAYPLGELSPGTHRVEASLELSRPCTVAGDGHEQVRVRAAGTIDAGAERPVWIELGVNGWPTSLGERSELLIDGSDAIISRDVVSRCPPLATPPPPGPDPSDVTSMWAVFGC